jgi:protein-S-isoprenylcysteine O-methyltransferase Ste14
MDDRDVRQRKPRLTPATCDRLLLMNPWFAKASILLGTIVTLAIGAYRHRGQPIQVLKSRKGVLERLLLALVATGFLLTLLWLATPALAFADYPLSGTAFSVGIACLGLGLWLLDRSHADLGSNWSITLEVRATHKLITRGVYHRIRHPMYAALLLYSLGQALVVPNWVAGLFPFLAYVLLFACRVTPEEWMMCEEFGAAYEAYRARTKRLIPGVW